MERRGGQAGGREGGMREGQVHGYPVWKGCSCTYLSCPHTVQSMPEAAPSCLPALCSVNAHPHKQYSALHFLSLSL